MKCELVVLAVAMFTILSGFKCPGDIMVKEPDTTPEIVDEHISGHSRKNGEDGSDKKEGYVKYEMGIESAKKNSTKDEDIVLFTKSFSYVNITNGDEYPNLKDSLSKLNAKQKLNVDYFASDILLPASEDLENRVNMTYWTPCYINVENTVTRNDSKVFSIFVNQSNSSGGLLIANSKNGINLDTATGKEIMLSDVIADEKLLTQLVYQKLIKDYSNIPLSFASRSDFEDQFLDKNKKILKSNYLLDEDGITIYFDQGQLSAFEYGGQEINIKYSDYPKLFVSDYFTEEDISIDA